MKPDTIFGAPRMPRRTPREAQRGVVLFIALIMLVAMTLSGIALMRSVDTTSVIAGNMAFKQGTMMATDVGVQAASQVLVSLGTATTADNLAQNFTATYDSAASIPSQLTGSTANALTDVNGSGNTVRYWLERMCLVAGAVSVTNCIREEGRNEPYFRVTTRVEGPRGTLAVTQSTIQRPGNFVPSHAMLTDGRLDLSSTISIGGNGGNVHSNTRVQMSGTTSLTAANGTVSAVGVSSGGSDTDGVHNSGSFPPPGNIAEGAAQVAVPEFNPTSFEQYADFKLKMDCSVANRANITLVAGALGRKWLGWTCQQIGTVAEPGTPPTLANLNAMARWALLDDNSWSTGIIYVEGHVDVGSSPGAQCSPAPCTSAKGPNPWVVTIIATGHLRFGNGNVQDYRAETLPQYAIHVAGASDYSPMPVPSPEKDPTSPAIPGTVAWPAAPEAVQNLFLVAGTDLLMNGSITQTGPEALFTAREQFTISGSSTLKGSIMAADKYTIDPFLTQNLVSGATTITYSGNLSTPLVLGVARRVTWRAIQ